jgi:hypothetical protein
MGGTLDGTGINVANTKNVTCVCEPAKYLYILVIELDSKAGSRFI